MCGFSAPAVQALKVKQGTTVPMWRALLVMLKYRAPHPGIIPTPLPGTTCTFSHALGWLVGPAVSKLARCSRGCCILFGVILLSQACPVVSSASGCQLSSEFFWLGLVVFSSWHLSTCLFAYASEQGPMRRYAEQLHQQVRIWLVHGRSACHCAAAAAPRTF